MHFLKTKRVIFLSGTSRTIGGPDSPQPDVTSRCMKRMQNWLELARHVLKAELPNFDALQAFTAFTFNDDHGDVDADLQRLSQLLSLNFIELKAQFEDFKPVAQRHHRTGQSAVAAWRLAIREVRGRATTRALHPSDVLEEALIRHVAWGGSTGGVERLFAKGKHAAGIARTDLDELLINDELQLVCCQGLGGMFVFQIAQDVGI